jgi:hypothetical protein
VQELPQAAIFDLASLKTKSKDRSLRQRQHRIGAILWSCLCGDKLGFL